MNNIIAVANVLEGTVEHRLMTAEELAQDEINRNEIAIKDAAFAAEVAAKEAARAALLAKLGITEDEAKLLLS